MKPKLAFIDHHYHRYTKRGNFLKEIFSTKFEVKHFYIKSDKDYPNNINEFDDFFCFQMLPPLSVLNKIKKKNIVWAPMYDSFHYPYNFRKTLWDIVEYFNIKVIFFSKKLKSYSLKNKINSIDLQYFVKNKKVTKNKSKLDILFWNRNSLKLADWIDIFDQKDINCIYYLGYKDSDNLITKNLNCRIKKIKSNFIKKNQFINFLKKTDVYICPRKKEGIGMGHVEAISYGKYLIAHNDATMNEYIINKKIGLLIDGKRQKVKKNLILSSKTYRERYALNGFKRYIDNQNQIYELFEKRINFNYNYMIESKIYISHFCLIVLWKIKSFLAKLKLI